MTEVAKTGPVEGSQIIKYLSFSYIDLWEKLHWLKLKSDIKRKNMK